MLSRIRTLTTPAAAALLLAGTALGTVAVAGPAAADAGGVPAIPLNTEQETTGSNTGASGFFSYTIEGSELCYTLTVRDLSADAVAAHIHLAPRHVAGPIVIPLAVAPGTSFELSTCVTVDAQLLAAVQENPRNYYVNVHTPTFPGGEVRGQLK
jgi:CHRD domain